MQSIVDIEYLQNTYDSEYDRPVDFVKKNVGTIGNDSQILKQAEFLLSWDITELLSETEMAYFKTTCVYLLWVIWDHLLLNMTKLLLIIEEPFVELIT